MFADDVEAFHDLWIIKDVFLKDTINSLISLHNAAKVNKKLSTPYIYKHYNVLPYHVTRSSALKGLARQLNPLLEALNERPRLPKYILLVPDRDIINETKAFSFGASYVLGSAIYFLIRQMDMLLSRRRIGLIDKKPDHLRLISITLDEADFDMSGYLTSKGKSTFWKEMDRGIMKFDQGEISLMPQSVSSQQNSENLNSKQVSQLNNTSRKSKAKSASPHHKSPKKYRIDSRHRQPSPSNTHRDHHSDHHHRRKLPTPPPRRRHHFPKYSRHHDSHRDRRDHRGSHHY